MSFKLILVVALLLAAPQIANASVLVVNKTPACAAADSDILYFQNISSAVSSAGGGDLILVCPGNYAENIIVDKSLTIQGIGPASSVVLTPTNQRANTINVTSDNVTIMNMTLKGNRGPVSSAIYGGGVKNLGGSFLEIYNNTYGFYTKNSDSPFLFYSSIHNNTFGVQLRATNKAIAVGNDIYFGTYGFYIDSSTGTLISDNLIHNNTQGVGTFTSKNTSIVSNQIYSNIYNGIHDLLKSNSTAIISNSIYSNKNNGIYIENPGAVGYTISNNNLTGNYQNGIYLKGISAFTIFGNTISSNKVSGIYFDSSSNNTLAFNEVSGSPKGFWLSGNSDFNSFSQNFLHDNDYGFYLSDVYGTPDYNTFSQDKIKNSRLWDFYSAGGGKQNSGMVALSDSVDFTFISFDSSFKYSATIVPPAAGYIPIERKIEIANTSTNGWIWSVLKYLAVDYSGYFNNVKFGKYNGAQVEIIEPFAVDETQDYTIIYYNFTRSGIILPEIKTSIKFTSSAPQTYSPSASAHFNLTSTDAEQLASAIVELNISGGAKNYTMASDGLGNFVFDIVPPAGNFYAKFYGEKLSGVYGTDNSYFSVQKNTNNPVFLLLNGKSENITITINDNFNALASSTSGSILIFRNKVDVSAENNISLKLPAGTYEYFANISENQNYTGNSTGVSLYLTVNTIPPPAPVEQQSVSSGGPYTRIILSGVPDSFSSETGSFSIKFKIENAGTADARDVSIELEGAPADWVGFSVVPKEILRGGNAAAEIIFAIPVGEKLSNKIKIIAKVGDSQMDSKEFFVEASSASAKNISTAPESSASSTTATTSQPAAKQTTTTQPPNAITGALTLVANSELGKIVLQFILAVANFLQAVFSFKPF